MHLEVPSRYVIAILVTMAMVAVCGMKTSLSIVILFMLNYTAMDEDRIMSDITQCPKPPEVVFKDGPFPWAWYQRGVVLCGYYVGNVLAQYPSILLTERMNSKWLLLGCVASNMLMSFISPFAAMSGSWWGLFIVRIFQGLLSGPVFPAAQKMMCGWIPPEERFITFVIIYSGASLGTVMASLASACICQYYGWKWTFWLVALWLLPWCIFWIMYASPTCENNIYVAPEEQAYIVTAMAADSTQRWVGYFQGTHRFPWDKAMTSIPFWAIIISHFCNNCGCAFVLILMPIYMQHVFHKRIIESATLSAVGYFCMWIWTMNLGFWMNYFFNRGCYTECVGKKIHCGISSLIPAACLVGICIIGCNNFIGEILVTVSAATCGALSFSIVANPMLLDPNHGVMLVTITNTIGELPGFIIPLIAGFVVNDEERVTRWTYIFIVIIAAYVVMFLSFVIAGSCKNQSWSKIEDIIKKKTDTEAKPRKYSFWQHLFDRN